MKIADEITPTAAEVITTRAEAPARMNWHRPEPPPVVLVALGTDALDQHPLTVGWWAEGVAFVLELPDAPRTVLGIPAARELAASILRQVDELRHDDDDDELELAGAPEGGVAG